MILPLFRLYGQIGLYSYYFYYNEYIYFVYENLSFLKDNIDFSHIPLYKKYHYYKIHISYREELSIRHNSGTNHIIKCDSRFEEPFPLFIDMIKDDIFNKLPSDCAEYFFGTAAEEFIDKSLLPIIRENNLKEILGDDTNI